jgi:hypothetical protein
MRYLAALFVFTFVLAIASCESGDPDQDVTSVLRVFNNTTGTEITRDGTINLIDGQTLQLRVMRVVDPEGSSPITTNVTTDADYNVEDTTVITVADEGSDIGLIEAQSAGSSDVNIVFRDGDGDETDDDEFDFTVNVNSPL